MRAKFNIDSSMFISPKVAADLSAGSTGGGRPRRLHLTTLDKQMRSPGTSNAT